MNDTRKIIEQAIRGKRTEATAGTAKMKKAVKMIQDAYDLFLDGATASGFGSDSGVKAVWKALQDAEQRMNSFADY